MRDLFNKLAQLTDKQAKAIEEQNTGDLLIICQEKQKIINKINSIPRDKRYSGLTGTESEEIARLIEEQLNAYKANEKQLRDMMGRLKSELSEISKGKVAAKSYLGQDASEPRFFDSAG